MHRSQAGQLEHWARIGRAIEHGEQFNYNRVALALKGEFAVDALSLYEKPVFDAMHDDSMSQSSSAEKQARQERMTAFRNAGISIDSLGD